MDVRYESKMLAYMNCALHQYSPIIYFTAAAACKIHSPLTSRHLVGMTVGVSLAVLLNVHLGTAVPQAEVQRVSVTTGLQARLARQLGTERVGSLIGLQGGALALKVRVDVLAGGDVTRSLDELQGETAVNVPGNVAMHEPGTRVVSLETDDCVASGETRTSRTLQHDSVTTGRVDEVEGADQVTGEGTSAGAENRHIVAVNVQRMRGKELVLDDEVDPGVGLVEDDRVADEAVGATISQRLESRLGVVDIDDGVVDVPLEDSAVVVGGNRGDGSSGDGGGRCLESSGAASRLLEVGHQRSERLILADVGGDISDRSRVDGSDSGSTLVVDNCVGSSKARVGAA
jgi:hypothetical protein